MKDYIDKLLMMEEVKKEFIKNLKEHEKNTKKNTNGYKQKYKRNR